MHCGRSVFHRVFAGLREAHEDTSAILGLPRASDEAALLEPVENSADCRGAQVDRIGKLIGLHGSAARQRAQARELRTAQAGLRNQLAAVEIDGADDASHGPEDLFFLPRGRRAA